MDLLLFLYCSINAKIHFFLLFAKKVVLLHPISQGENAPGHAKINPRKGARVVEEARLESE